MIVAQLNPLISPRFFAVPQVHLGMAVEIDIGTFDNLQESPESSTNGGLALWSPPEPTATLECDVVDPTEYEVLVYDAERDERLVAAIELISPANKDRPDHRRAFIHKCTELLNSGVSLILVDVNTVRSANLYRAIWEELDESTMSRTLANQYAVALKPQRSDDRLAIRCWENSLTVGQPLPTVPLWLDERQSVPLDLESSYAATLAALGITSPTLAPPLGH
jgi:hypothetical protein